MKTFTATTLFCIVISIPALLSWKHYEKPRIITFSKPTVLPITMCGAQLADWSDTTLQQIKILPGLGNLHYKITTTSPKAQEFFDQGLRLVYAFNHWEAIQAFREASRLDPDCAMAYWGLALAYGPNLNDVNPADREKIAFDNIQKAVNKKRKATLVEQALIDAMAARYDGKTSAQRDLLNQAYAKAMQRLSSTFGNDPEVQTLCADAIMNTMPWDYWDKNGSPKVETARARAILENALRKFPQHPGAHHLYIHLMEASPSPAVALASADFLVDAMPAAGHLVHMPGHIYIRTGQYNKSIEVNQRAVLVDEEYLSNSDNRGLYRMMYYPHNVDFISFSAYMGGRSDLAIQNAMKLAYKGSMITNANPVFAQYFLVEPLIGYTRFGKWNDILSLPEPDNKLTYAHVVFRFARGMAYLRKGKMALASNELVKLDSLCKLDTLENTYFSINPASDIAQIPLQLLSGEIKIRTNHLEEGIEHLRAAVAAEDNLRYMEPPDWKIPSRHFLGASLYEAGRFGEAEAVYLEDLKRNPENGWAVNGLMLCQEKLGKLTDAAATAKRLSKCWTNADIKIASSRF
jgi:tetratricopeptide (TPR) repeat protein